MGDRQTNSCGAPWREGMVPRFGTMRSDIADGLTLSRFAMPAGTRLMHSQPGWHLPRLQVEFGLISRPRQLQIPSQIKGPFSDGLVRILERLGGRTRART